ncbi:MAG: hypothetical protein U0931_14150 [Vulcanimicrobiota bacterium]
MGDNLFWIGLLVVVLAQIAGPFWLARMLRNRPFAVRQLWATGLLVGALVGLGAGYQDGQWGPDLFAGMVMTAPVTLIGILCRRWCLARSNGQRAFYLLVWWSLSSTWFFALGGFVALGFLAGTLGNTGSDGVLGTAIKIGALGGGLCGLALGGPLGLVRMLMVARPKTAAPVDRV